ncbi:unnamed protein product [Orchesella dallaii]|uniref:F-box domain-containing protein n=1 Tax=Orchesella dallaii TaxID=48710 RepID=A0ABP1QVS4_9HEXA
MDLNGTSKEVEEEVSQHYVSPPVTPEIAPTPPPPHLSGETCWDNLPPEVQEMVVEKLGDKPKLLRYRLVSSSWKKTVDMILERQFLSVWTEWEPFEQYPYKMNMHDYYDYICGYDELEDDDRNPTTGVILARAIIAGVPRLRPIWSHFAEHDRKANLIPSFDHHLPAVHNPKLGSPIPSNCLRIRFNDKIWPEIKRFERSRRAKTLADFVVKYDHCFSYLRALLLTDIEISPSNLATILGKLTNLRALTLEDTLLHVEPETQEENAVLPLHSNLSHLRIISTNSSASQLILKAYHEQVISLETNCWVPLFSKPYGNLKRLKLITNLKPDAQFRQGEENPFPALKYLSIIIHEGHVFEWDELSRTIDACPRTLINLYLDIEPRWETEEDKIRQLAMSQVTIPNVKTLGIFLPTIPQHAECLRRLILPKFPSVQQINLISGSWGCRSAIHGKSENETEVYDREEVIRRLNAAKIVAKNVERMVLELQFYATVCPKLEYIVII